MKLKLYWRITIMKMISELTDHEHVEGQFLVGNDPKGVNTIGGY